MILHTPYHQIYVCLGFEGRFRILCKFMHEMQQDFRITFPFMIPQFHTAQRTHPFANLNSYIALINKSHLQCFFMIISFLLLFYYFFCCITEEYHRRKNISLMSQIAGKFNKIIQL